MTRLEAEQDEVLRMIAALEKHREVPRHLRPSATLPALPMRRGRV